MRDSNTQTQLKQLREARGLTQDQLAEMTGINRVSIARYETTDRGMTLDSAQRLAEALGCTVDELIKPA